MEASKWLAVLDLTAGHSEPAGNQKIPGHGIYESCQTSLHLCQERTAVGQEGASRAPGIPKCATFPRVGSARVASTPWDC